jgi:Carboxypeptidase regulatory-like domain/TonB dependent receptor/TonB-dependent Receptor Plug Domain
MPRRAPLCILVVLVSLVSVSLVAQTVTGTLSGTVSDRSGAAIPGVTVTAKNAETGLERIIVTNETGYYNAPFLPVGVYNVQAELAGFGSMRRSNVRVDLNTTVVQDFLLDPSMAESITVEADAPRINVTDGEIKQTMRAEEIMTIPASGQTNFLQLASTFAGFQDNPTSTSADNPTLSVGSSANFNGAGTRGTTFQINGVNNDDSSENQHRQGVALATIKSFQVLSNSYSAEFGRGYGAVVLVQTKSGTNDIAGELYGYTQDGEWNEKRSLEEALPKPDNYRREYGGVAGFPIARDSIFAFLNYGVVVNKGQLIANRPVILPADMNLPRLTLSNNTTANRAWQDSVLARFPSGLTPNNPALGARAYSYPQFRDWPDTDYSFRLDWNANASHNIYARYQYSDQVRENTELIVGEQTLQDNNQSNFGATWTGVLSSTTVAEARIGLGLRDTNVNLLSGNDTPIIRWAAITPGHIIGNAGAYPINRDQRDQQFVLNLSTARFNKHTLKIGTDIRRSELDDRASNNNRGFWNFTAACGGVTYSSGLAAFMAGCVATFQKSYGPDFLENEISEINVYAQDDWRPFDNLTLNLGVRFEQAGAPKEKENRIDYFYGDTQYIDPRLGFAYTPDWDKNRFLRGLTGGQGKFSIRGGYGVYHGRVFQSIFSQGGANVRYNPPNAVSLTISNSTNIADPTNGFVFVPGQPLTQRVALTLIDPDLQMPESRQWNLSFERQLFTASKLRMSYIGALGKNLLQYRFDNLPLKPGSAGTQYVLAADPVCAGTGLAGAARTAQCPVDVPIGQFEVSLRFPRTNERRPDARYTTNLIVDNIAESSYHGGQLEFETGLMRGFQGRMTYTFSKAIDSGSEATASGGGDINIFPPEQDDYKRGLSRFDTRHRFAGTASYQLPWFRDTPGWKSSILGGWTLSGVVRLASGTPFTLIDTGAVDIDFDGVANQRPIAVDPRYAGGWTVNNPNTSRDTLPATAFRRATPADQLSDLMGRNTYFTDGLESVDAGLYKTFRAPLGSSVVLRLDVFNVFNHVTWGIPTNDFASVNFGRILGTNPGYNPRTFQLGLRYIF